MVGVHGACTDGYVTKLYLPNKGSLAEAKQAYNQNHDMAGKVML